LKTQAWIKFAVFSAIFTYWGIHQIFIIPTLQNHWDWLAPIPELIEYIHFRFRQLGAITLANGVFTFGVSLTGFRKQEQWAWGALAVVPVYILLLTAISRKMPSSSSPPWKCVTPTAAGTG
jgi:hypothetical protein